MNKLKEKINKLFEWTDFSGDIGAFVLAKKSGDYETKEIAIEEVENFFKSELQNLKEEVENWKKELDNTEGLNEQDQAHISGKIKALKYVIKIIEQKYELK